MSDDGFLKRWSRRKRGETPPAEAPARDSSPAARPPSNPPPQQAVPPARRSDASEPDEIDPATLPPLDSLGPDSDYTVFLKKGVPEALRIAALRKAWALDPFIRDFRSPAIDYGWDFTTSDYALRPTDDVAKLVDRIFPDKAAAETVPSPPRTAAAAAVTSKEPKVEAPNLAQQRPAAPTDPDRVAQPVSSATKPRRRHGGALPESDGE